MLRQRAGRHIARSASRHAVRTRWQSHAARRAQDRRKFSPEEGARILRIESAHGLERGLKQTSAERTEAITVRPVGQGSRVAGSGPKQAEKPFHRPRYRVAQCQAALLLLLGGGSSSGLAGRCGYHRIVLRVHAGPNRQPNRREAHGHVQDEKVPERSGSPSRPAPPPPPSDLPRSPASRHPRSPEQRDHPFSLQLYSAGAGGIRKGSSLQVLIYLLLVYGGMQRVVDPAGDHIGELLGQDIYLLGGYD